MADIGVSETQFAFAWFHKYLNQQGGSNLNFSFPSIKQEGTRSLSGGYDLKISGNYFIQFKMSEIFFKPSSKDLYTKEIKDGSLSINDYPYFRFKVYNSQKTQQLNNLIRLSSLSGNIVEYVAPIFTDEDQFFARFHDVKQDIGASFRVDRLNTKNIQAGENHVVCYNESMIKDGLARMFSEPTNVDCKLSSESINTIKESLLVSQSNFSIETISGMFNETFKGLNVSEEDGIDNIQRKLLANSGVYWLPLIKT